MKVSIAIKVACFGVEEANKALDGEGVVALLEKKELFEGLLLEKLFGPFVGNGCLPMFFAGYVGS